jgi:hypothetical protein
MRKWIILVVLFLCLAVEAQDGSDAASRSSGAEFGAKWKSLEGDWSADPGPGGGNGSCAFHFALNQHVLVRTNHAELTGQGSAPAGIHEDLMVIYPGEGEDQAHATYWDNEGHVIQYSASWSADGNALTFLSKPGAGPQFRLTYKKVNSDTLTVSFDMAPPGNPGAFKVYTSGRIRRTTKP